MPTRNRIRREDEDSGTSRERANQAETRPLDRAAELLRTGDEAIERALSGDSVAFLAASRQPGGQ